MQEEEGLISLAWQECLEGNVKSLLHPMPQTQSSVPMKREGRHVKLLWFIIINQSETRGF